MNSQSFLALGERLRDDLSRHEVADRASEASARRRLLVAVAAAQPRRRMAVLAGGGAVLAAAVALVLWFRPAAPATPLSFWVEERAGQVDEWVRARDTEQSLRFSDGSSIVAAPRTTTRVMRVAAAGAELALEHGELQAHVVHREASRWQVAAGPFVVHVTGTRFRVSWDPQAEKLNVSVSEGKVLVTGGGQPRHELLAGSSLELSATAGVELKSAHVAAEMPSAAASEPHTEIAEARDEDELLRPRKAVERKPDFRELSTAGHYREALALVEQQGFASECQSLSARDLLTLGSTARLAGRADRAEEAYRAVRRRFPSSSEAGISAFSLGRLASDAGRASDAMAWFKRYLSEQPGGALAREAAGRLLELLSRGGDAAAAREAATSYLKQYPSGPHAALAQSVLARR
jgi:TolA-binding protein